MSTNTRNLGTPTAFVQTPYYDDIARAAYKRDLATLKSNTLSRRDAQAVYGKQPVRAAKIVVTDVNAMLERLRASAVAARAAGTYDRLVDGKLVLTGQPAPTGNTNPSLYVEDTVVEGVPYFTKGSAMVTPRTVKPGVMPTWLHHAAAQREATRRRQDASITCVIILLGYLTVTFVVRALSLVFG